MKFLKPEEYQKGVYIIYGDLYSRIKNILPQATIEHIGSSAIPHMISKGDLDIYVEVPKDIMKLSQKLIESLGFVEKEGTLQNKELRMLISNDFNINVAVQLVARDSKYEFFKTFRDLLVENEEYRKKYNLLKLSCSNKSEKEYRKIKTAFIKNVLNI